jgi:PadR family transcriptional regulator, regulatory protein AphA
MATGTTPSILGLLARQPMTGYELKSAIEESIGNFWSESFGQIYPELRRLEEQGLVTSQLEGGTKAKRRYAVTASGREALRAWLAEPPKLRPPRNELLLKLFFGAQADPAQLLDHVEAMKRQYEAHLAKLARRETYLQEKYTGNPGLPFWLITVRNGIFSYQALVEWCDQTIETLGTLQPPKP